MAAIYWDMEKTSRGHYRITCRPLADNVARNSSEEITRSYAAMLEKTITRNPAIWLWTQKMETSCRPIVAVILNWNGESLRGNFSRRWSPPPTPAITRLVVADNGSDDGSLRYLRDNWEAKGGYPFLFGKSRIRRRVTTAPSWVRPASLCRCF